MVFIIMYWAILGMCAVYVADPGFWRSRFRRWGTNVIWKRRIWFIDTPNFDMPNSNTTIKLAVVFVILLVHLNLCMNAVTYVRNLLFPIHVICWTGLVHLLHACKVAIPFFPLIAHMYKNPSLVAPKLARYRESGLNATAHTPNVCSARAVRGVSDIGLVSETEKIRTRGLYPVWGRVMLVIFLDN